MNSNSRILPHLNVCYMQKKAYDVHRKKIDYIKQSIRTSLAKKLSGLGLNQSTEQGLSRKDSSNRMGTIKQQASERKFSKMSAFDRKRYYDQLKENQRFFKKIQKSQATISRKIIERHSFNTQQYKNRISKFKNDPKTSKSLLKSEYSLQLLEKIRGKEKFKQLLHRHNQNIQSKFISLTESHQKSKTLLSNLSNFDSPKIKTEVRQRMSKKQSFNKLMARRNSQKIHNHFQREEYLLKPQKKFSPFGQETNRSKKQRKAKTQASNNYNRSRCFTTQVENYN